MSHAIVPTSQLGSRIPEHGRIRMGVETGQPGLPFKSIDTFRFTSPDQLAIKQLAERYGGDAKPWSNAKASPQNQFEVITRSSEIRVFLPPNSVSTAYEMWTGGGCARRCDGETCELAGRDGMESVPCLCRQPTATHPDGVMSCKPYTRLNVILPDVRFGGTWRLETKGWNAAHEMPGMAEMIERLHAGGLAEAKLRVDRETQMVGGKKKHFVVPRLLIPMTPAAMLEGGAQVALQAGEQRALPAATPEEREAAGPLTITREDQAPEQEWFDPDEDIVDAEIVPPSAEEGMVAAVTETFPGSTVMDPANVVHFADGADFLCFGSEGSTTTEIADVDCGACRAEHAARNREPGQAVQRTKKRAANPALAKLNILCAEVAADLTAAEALYVGGSEPLEDELRHAMAWYVSAKATESSAKLDPEAMGKAIDLLEKVKVNLPQGAKLVMAFRGRPM